MTVGRPSHDDDVGDDGGVVATSADSATADVMRAVLRDGGTAADAGAAGALFHAAREPQSSGLAGSITLLYWDAASRTAFQLDGGGRFPADLTPVRPVANAGPFGVPAAALPRFVPALGVLHGRFGRLNWARLCEPAAEEAERGRPVGNQDFATWLSARGLFAASPEARALFTAGGDIKGVGSLFSNPALAETLRTLAEAGPDLFVTGAWAQAFVKCAEAVGWPISRSMLAEHLPALAAPLDYSHCGHRLVQLGPPSSQGPFCAMVLGLLRVLGRSPDTGDGVYDLGHALRRAQIDIGYLHDAEEFGSALDEWLDPAYHAMLARVIGGSRPRADMRQHYDLMRQSQVTASWGLPTFTTGVDVQGGSAAMMRPIRGMSATVVDRQGNWLTMLASAANGGIPGAVVGGVMMLGSDASIGHQRSATDVVLAGAGRLRTPAPATFLMKDGAPSLALSATGNVHCTIPQILQRIIDFDFAPDAALAAPRATPIDEHYGLRLEAGLDGGGLETLARLGLQVRPLRPHDPEMGVVSLCWRDQAGAIRVAPDPRRLDGGAALS